jgi:hypothetical protein
MQKTTASFSLDLVKAAKSTFFKTVFVSISMLAFGSVSAHAAGTKPDMTIYTFDGYGDAVRTTGDKVDPDIFEIVSPVADTGWDEVDNFSQPYIAAVCTKSDKNTCDVTLGKKVENLTAEQQKAFKQFWFFERIEDDLTKSPSLVNGSAVGTSSASQFDSIQTNKDLDSILDSIKKEKNPDGILKDGPNFLDPNGMLELERRLQERQRELQREMERAALIRKCVDNALQIGLDPKLCYSRS